MTKNTPRYAINNSHITEVEKMFDSVNGNTKIASKKIHNAVVYYAERTLR